MTRARPEQGTSPAQHRHISSFSLGPASICSLGFSQHGTGPQNGNFCHFWQAHPFPQRGTHGSRQKHRQTRQLLMSASCSKGQGATAWEKKAWLNPVRSQLSQCSPGLLAPSVAGLHKHSPALPSTHSPDVSSASQKRAAPHVMQN